ncbi:MAG: hypothetical protein BWX88_03760 [Planctomycetes bacterium ADurb.Bin126]|nr:MAG: hypothetical protein BWX88_03760 [Planctomycetes bacterium ADurb.Bin126]
MEQEELVPAVSVAAVHLLDGFDGCLKRRRVLGQVLVVRVAEVGQQHQQEVLRAVGQVADLHLVGQLPGVLRAGDQRGHDDGRRLLLLQALGQVQAGHAIGGHQQGAQPVDQREGRLARRQQHRAAQDHKGRPAVRVDQDLRGQQQRPRQHQQGQHQEVHIDLEGPASADAGQAPAQRGAVADLPLQFQPPRYIEVIAHVALAVAVALAEAVVGQAHRALGYLFLLPAAAPGQVLDDVAVIVARGEVAAGVHPARVAPQHRLGHAQRFDEVPPVDRPQCPQAGDAVADRHLVGGLVLALGLLDRLQRLPPPGQLILQPVDGQVERDRLEPARQLGDERRRRRRIGADQVGQRGDQVPSALTLGPLEPLRPLQRQVAVLPPPGDAVRHPPQVLDQRQAEHDRHRPQLAQPQRRHALIRPHELRDHLGVDPAVGVADQLHRQRVHPREALQLARGQPRELAAVVRGQVLAGDADLLLDEVVVVEQPFGRGGHLAPLADRLGDRLVRADDDLLVGVQAVQQPLRARTNVHRVLHRQRPQVRLQLPRAEQFGPKCSLCLFLLVRSFARPKQAIQNAHTIAHHSHGQKDPAPSSASASP